MRILLFLSISICYCFTSATAQLAQVAYDYAIYNSQDSIAIKKKQKTPLPKGHTPKKATIRSAILPGLGQAYNREYWKIPLVYGALSIPAATYAYNTNWYKKTKLAYEIRVTNDTARFREIDPKLQPLQTQDLQSYRNIFRRDRDYSVLWFLIVWGLNVVDATVFGHLRGFDVSDDLSLQLKPTLSTQQQGLTLAVQFKSSKEKIAIAR